MTEHKIKFKKPAAVRNAEAIKVALATPRTPAEIAELVHLTQHSVERYLCAMRNKREVYRSSYRIIVRDGGKKFPVPVYSLGARSDAVYKPFTKAEHAKKYYERRKLDPERYDRYLSKERNRHISFKPQAELAYFFGIQK